MKKERDVVYYQQWDSLKKTDDRYYPLSYNDSLKKVKIEKRKRYCLLQTRG